MDVLKVSALDAKANYKVYLLLLILFSLWLFAQRLIMYADPSSIVLVDFAKILVGFYVADFGLYGFTV
jgi:hypothetical protein